VAKECSLKCAVLNRHAIIDGCWEWTGKVGKNGYGTLVHAEKGKRNHLLAHRVMYEIFIGPIPNGKFVCHTCDNRKCINPDHLWVGTHSENMKDAANKGRIPAIGRKHTEETKKKFKLRSRPQKKGESSWLSKLKEYDVLRIREMLSKGIKQKYIMNEYGISRSCLYMISVRETWFHI
jgi:hypothetical protein